MRRLRRALLLAGLAVFGTAPGRLALAQELQLSQPGIAVEASAEDGVRARELALNQGRRAAWNRLLEQGGIRGVPNLSDAQIDGLVQSIVVEQERPAPTRYSGQLTVNFSPRAVQRVLGDRAPVIAGADGQAPAPPVAIHAEAMASYGSLREWQEIRRRLRSAPGVAGVELRGVATDGARLRLTLRRPASEVMNGLSGLSGILMPSPAPGQAEYWQLSLGG